MKLPSLPGDCPAYRRYLGVQRSVPVRLASLRRHLPQGDPGRQPRGVHRLREYLVGHDERGLPPQAGGDGGGAGALRGQRGASSGLQQGRVAYVACDDWLPANVKAEAPAIFAAHGMGRAMDARGMVAERLVPPSRPLPPSRSAGPPRRRPSATSRTSTPTPTPRRWRPHGRRSASPPSSPTSAAATWATWRARPSRWRPSPTWRASPTWVCGHAGGVPEAWLRRGCHAPRPGVGEEGLGHRAHGAPRHRRGPPRLPAHGLPGHHPLRDVHAPARRRS